MTAIWCPRCGGCKCPLNEAGERSLDGSACPLHAPDSAHGEPAGLVRARHLGDRDRAPPTLLRQLLTDARSNLEGWAEPNGYLVPSEPDLEERARIRISLRGLITGYMIALGEEPPRSQFEKDDLRDRLRIAEAAVADQEACPDCGLRASGTGVAPTYCDRYGLCEWCGARWCPRAYAPTCGVCRGADR